MVSFGICKPRTLFGHFFESFIEVELCFRRQLSTFIKQEFSPFAIFTVSIAFF